MLPTESFLLLEIETRLPEGQCRISIAVKYTLHNSERIVSCG